MYTREAAEYFGSLEKELVELIEALCAHPAPSGEEGERAEFCRDWLSKKGCEGVYIDEAKNVIYPLGCGGKDKYVLFTAHTDTVFPDTEPMPFVNDGEYLRSPGVGDDTACLAMLMLTAAYASREKPKSDWGIIFAANSCEEGLGNLRGIRQIMADYGDKIVEAYAFDATYNHIFNRCVGSERYRVRLKTRGGHSYYDFGSGNAIAEAARLITELYKQSVPKAEMSKTTYNVGIIEGGCSVNTIAEEASFLYEYRSDDYESLESMRRQFFGVLESYKAYGEAEISLETVGERPCARLADSRRLEEMSRLAMERVSRHTAEPCIAEAASTDCNIPMSMGVPAICIGSYMGDGAHTRAEKIRIDSLIKGLGIVAETVLDFFE